MSKQIVTARRVLFHNEEAMALHVAGKSIRIPVGQMRSIADQLHDAADQIEEERAE